MHGTPISSVAPLEVSLRGDSVSQQSRVDCAGFALSSWHGAAAGAVGATGAVDEVGRAIWEEEEAMAAMKVLVKVTVCGQVHHQNPQYGHTDTRRAQHRHEASPAILIPRRGDTRSVSGHCAVGLLVLCSPAPLALPPPLFSPKTGPGGMGGGRRACWGCFHSALLHWQRGRWRLPMDLGLAADAGARS